MKLKNIYAISGIDGSGKSTQIRKINEKIFSKQAVIIWLRFGYTPGVELLKSFYLSLKPSHNLNSNKIIESRRPELSNSKILYFISLIDYVLYNWYVLFFSILKQRVIIFDRYHLDSSYDVCQKYGNGWPQRLFDIVCRFLPNTQSQIVLLVSVLESVERSIKKGDPYAEDAVSLQLKWSFYHENAKYIIDAKDDVETVFDTITKNIFHSSGVPFQQVILLAEYFNIKEIHLVSRLLTKHFTKITGKSIFIRNDLQLGSSIKLHPELWEHTNFVKKFTLRFILISNFTRRLYRSITTRAETSGQNLPISSFVSNNSSLVCFLSGGEALSIFNSTSRNLYLEQKFRREIFNGCTVDIKSYGVNSMLEAYVEGNPLNRAPSERKMLVISEIITRLNNRKILAQTLSEGILIPLRSSSKLLESSFEPGSKEIQKCIIRLADKVGVTHGAQIVTMALSHNDLHQGNILICEDNSHYIIDFEAVDYAISSYDPFILNTNARMSNFSKELEKQNVSDFEKLCLVLCELKFRLSEWKRINFRNGKYYNKVFQVLVSQAEKYAESSLS